MLLSVFTSYINILYIELTSSVLSVLNCMFWLPTSASEKSLHELSGPQLPALIPVSVA